MPCLKSTLNSQDECFKVSSQPSVGIIYPPPEVRNIIDKTASFVARNGLEFELRIQQNELENPKFNFLNQGDPYNAYYQHKIKEFKEGEAQDAKVAVVSQQKAGAVFLRQQELLKQAEDFLLKDPPPDFEYITEPPSISALDIDIVKLTAQFVARNGRLFLTNLMNKEHRNFQFDFLRPHHTLFQYFTKLLEQYTKVLIPAKDMMTSLETECVSPSGVLEQVRYRAGWLRCKDAQSRREEELLERERIAYAQIDWHDFVLVETVEYLVEDVGNFPPPTNPQRVGARILMQERIEESGQDEVEDEESDDDYGVENIQDKVKELEEEMNSEEESEVPLSREDGNGKDVKDNNQVEDMEEDSETEEEALPSPKPSVPLPSSNIPPDPDTVIVKKDYDPKLAAKTIKPQVPEEFLISPITGEKIPANKVQEHIRIGLLDPLWVEQRDKQLEEKLNQESVYVAGSAIGASLKLLAERRTDIFGVGDEETGIGKKIGEEEKKEEKVTWDGHTSSVEAATRAARANITIEDQIHQIHKVKGLLPDEEKERIGPKHIVCTPPPPPPLTTQPPLPPPPHNLPPHPPPVMMVPPLMRPPMMVPQPRPQFNMMPLVPPPTMMPTFASPLVTQVHQPLLMQVAEEGSNEPAAKKMRTEESLVPEHVFLDTNKSPVTFAVAVPRVPERTEWKLKGQVLTVTLPLGDSVSVIKAKVHEATQVPPGKQKLQWEGMFFKDTNSLAFYNVSPATTIQLHLKERGGRKK